MRLMMRTKTMPTLVTKLLQLWWYHLPYSNLVLGHLILASFPVYNRPSCQWMVVLGGVHIVNIS
eukprot:11231919-Ditylum_brightwellii.AAC.1